MTHAFGHEYWDQIWGGDRAVCMGTGQPNPHVLLEVGDLAAGTALEAGCGAGAEAIWLAQRGWQVTAVDIAAAALDRAAERAVVGGVAGQVQWVLADLSTWDPGTRYDLVTTHYAHSSLPQLELYDRIASWVAPGGTLLIVGHALQEGHEHPQDGPPTSASATAATVAARLHPASWEVVAAHQTHRTVPAHKGHEGHEATLRDVVVRAVRRR